MTMRFQSDIPQYVLSKQDKISILQQLLQEFLPETPLKVNESLCGIYQDNGTSSHFYEILGNTQKRKTQNSNLQYKLKDLDDQVVVYTHQSQKGGNQQEPSQNRYFKPNIRCFRCRQYGHYSSHCPDEATFCLNCLAQDHTSQSCPQKTVCFRCYQFGHIANNCRSLQGVFCRVCNRKHRQQCGFLAKGYDNNKTIIVRQTPQIQDVLCLCCQKLGHINCMFGDQF